ncbi:DUF6538 domain-containing protein [Bosea minatitlanensis]|nr:DUF6538 domain-containing protein [Bosea minatitlanensis]MCT4495652.1 hypothetical protein [Bosea minatitlanensis]
MPRFGLVPFTKQDVKGGIFRFRLQLPDDVFERLVATGTAGVRRTVTFSLRTRDPMAARSRALRASAERWSGAISMKLNRTIDEALGRDRRLTVHSLRKTFEHAAYVIGVPKPASTRSPATNWATCQKSTT